MNKEVMIGTWAWGPGFNGSKQVFGNNYDEEILRETFERAVNLGLTRWDTAAVYGMGSCEKILGKVINGRDGIFISTKFFPDKKFREGALEKSFHESMTRLNLKSADLFWIHKPNNLTKNLQEAVPLLQDGRIRSIGISNVSLKDIRTAEDILSREGLSLGAVQNHFSLLRNDQQPLIDYCNSKGITYYAYMVLEQGALAGRYNVTCPFPLLSMRRLAFPKSKFRKIESLLKLMEQTALKYNIDKSQIPVLWVIAKGAVPIIGITKPVYAERLAEALQVDLTPEEIEQLTSEAAATGIRQQGSWEPQ